MRLLIDDHDRVFQIERGALCQHSVEQPEHLRVGVRAVTEQDETGTVGLVERNEAGIVQAGVRLPLRPGRAPAARSSDRPGPATP
jgi:hypothetical protein